MLTCTISARARPTWTGLETVSWAHRYHRDTRGATGYWGVWGIMGPRDHNTLVTWQLSYQSDPKSAMTSMLGAAGAMVNQLGGPPGSREQAVYCMWSLGPLGAVWAVEAIEGGAPQQALPKPIPGLPPVLVSLRPMPDPGTGCPAPHPGAN